MLKVLIFVSDGSWKLKDGFRIREGQGIYVEGPEKYEGQWVDDMMEGAGKYYFASGATYEVFAALHSPFVDRQTFKFRVSL
jgi:hypothetical protein